MHRYLINSQRDASLGLSNQTSAVSSDSSSKDVLIFFETASSLFEVLSLNEVPEVSHWVSV